MKYIAFIAVFLLSSLASASDIEEVVVREKQIKINFIDIKLNHKQNPFTGNWYYVETDNKKEQEYPKLVQVSNKPSKYYQK